MKKTENVVYLKGRVYQHNLEVREVKNTQSANFGKPYIGGTLDIATDEEGLNVVTINYSYVTEFTSKGTENRNYAALSKIINGDAGTWIELGKEGAQCVTISSSVDVNDFYNQNDELISAKRVEGGFLTLVPSLQELQNKFITDMVINNVITIEADGEKVKEDYAVVKGAIFNFRGDLLPVEYNVKDAKGRDYFLGLGISTSEPMFLKVWGEIKSQTIVTEIAEESAFGEASVRKMERKYKDWLLTGAKTEAFEIGEGLDISPAEMTTAMENRAIKIAEVKTRRDEYIAAKSNPVAAITPKAATSTDFKF